MKTFSLYDIESILNIDTDTVKITFEHVKKLVEIQKNCWLNKYTQKEVENLSTREKLDLKENISDDFFSENDVTCLEEYKLAEYDTSIDHVEIQNFRAEAFCDVETHFELEDYNFTEEDKS